MPLEQQLKEIIQQNSGDFENNEPNVNNNGLITDIKDGKFYKEFLQLKNNDRKKITLVMNTDGV